MEPNGNSHVSTGHPRRFIRIGTTIPTDTFLRGKKRCKRR
ncbi:unnamed protein product [Brassica oleracea var. botrytis]|uniref:Uncharacterized protein n=1 Tax=Brassica oleracea TaxID=3712 RepID=A0A3P6GT49_BRAOL|nr:unnamed protein product [Brassica oleracea]